MNWQIGTVVKRRDETQTSRTLTLDVPGWPGHVAGQHVDVRLTAPDGYTATRSYSIASAPDGERIALTVERLADGEVSPYLTDVVEVGDPLELRGPVGGWFVWRPSQPEPVQLLAGGSGLVPLMAMVRTHGLAQSKAPIQLLYSVRDPLAIYYEMELKEHAENGVGVTYAFTRQSPEGWPRPPGRIDAELLAEWAFQPSSSASCYVCGPTGFVEAVADLLVHAGHDPARIKTERFGPSGGLR
jgi:ferredoxin-NADP reductase